MKDEAFGFNGVLETVDMGGDVDFIACRLCRTRHGEAVRNKITVIGDKEE